MIKYKILNKEDRRQEVLFYDTKDKEFSFQRWVNIIGDKDENKANLDNVAKSIEYKRDLGIIG